MFSAAKAFHVKTGTSAEAKERDVSSYAEGGYSLGKDVKRRKYLVY